jgi:hypothetical protein
MEIHFGDFTNKNKDYKLILEPYMDHSKLFTD